MQLWAGASRDAIQAAPDTTSYAPHGNGDAPVGSCPRTSGVTVDFLPGSDLSPDAQGGPSTAGPPQQALRSRTSVSVPLPGPDQDGRDRSRRDSGEKMGLTTR